MENTINQKALLIDATNDVRVEFLKKTYKHVAGGVLLFVIFEYFLLQSEAVVTFMLSMTQGYKWLIMLGGFMFITSYAENTALKTADKNKQYLAYAAYVFMQALIFVPLLYIAIFYTESGNALIEQGIKKEKITKFSRMAENILRGNNRELKVSIEIIEITEIEYSARTEVLYLKMPVT